MNRKLKAARLLSGASGAQGSCPEVQDLTNSLERMSGSSDTFNDNPPEPSIASDFTDDFVEEEVQESTPGGPSTPDTMLVERHHPLLKAHGNIFVACIACASMVLLVTNATSVRNDATGEAQPNATMLSVCPGCERARCILGQKHAHLYFDNTLALDFFADSRILKIPRKIMGTQVPIGAGKNGVRILPFALIKATVKGEYKVLGVDTSRSLDSEEDLFLSYVPGNFV